MNTQLRKPAWTPPPVVIADPWLTDPTPQVQAWFQAVFTERMSDLPFLNPRLQVEVIGMQRLAGDWLGALVTPWSIQLILLPGGGDLWVDLAAGCRHTVALPIGPLWFLADAGEAGLQAYQYCPLTTSVESFADTDAARRFAAEALATALAADPRPAPPVTPTPAAVNLARRGLLGLRRRSVDV